MCKPLIVLLMSLSCSTVLGQSGFTVHHHWIGEPVKSFLASEPGIVKGLSDCESIRSNPQPWVQKNDPNYLLGFNNLKHPTQADISHARQQVDLVLMKYDCPQLERIFIGRGDAFIDRLSGFGDAYGALNGTLSAEWFFDRGVLVKIIAFFPSGDFAEVVADISKRFGGAPTLGESPMQNSFGAKWKDRSAMWLSMDLHCALEERNNPSAHSLTLTVESRSDFDRKVADFRSRPSPLD